MMMFARTEKQVDEAIANPRAVMAMAAAVFAMPIALVVWGVPALGVALAPYLPASFERALAEDSLALIESQSEESELDDTSQEYLRRKFDQMKAIAGVPEATLVFKNWIPNAVTLPGGTIIITDALIKTVGATDGSVAVLAHEIAHAKLKHTSQHIFTGTAMWSIVLPMISGDRATGKIAGSVGEIFLDSRYSRSLEREADAFAHQLLAQIGQNPRTLGTALEQLESQYGGGAKRERGQSTYASSHPATDDRVEASAAAEASARAKGQIK
jgi:beta-barrel assembly-enhancing protease